ncbi:MAG TPA: arginase family protein [Pyrinomonadaceae bacterium]|jgi:arginase|nr:arginase family protein [Pyrinomonadaceae bacterium]
MKVQIIQVPYDSGQRNVRMGAGPIHFVQNGVLETLLAQGHDAQVEIIEASSLFRAEIKTAFELCRLLAERVREARAEGRFPLVLSGNCNSSLGTLAGLGPADLGMIWFDAHGDFNTPETRESSFFDGMGMAVATGHCWKKLAATIPGFGPLPDAHVIHVGGRDFDPEEGELLERSGIAVVRAERIRQTSVRAALGPTLESLSSRVRKLYLHIDLDVLDPAATPANEYAARVPGGLTVEQIAEAIQLIGERFTICASGIASYDPKYDEKGQTFAAGVRIIKSLLATNNS